MNNFSKTSLALSILLCGSTMFAQEQQPAPPQGQNAPAGYGPERYGAPAQGQPAPYPGAGGRYAQMPQTAPVAMPTADLLLPAGVKEVLLLDNFAFGTLDAIDHLKQDPRVKIVRADVMRLPDSIFRTTRPAS